MSRSSASPNHLIVAEACTWFVDFRYGDVDDEAGVRFSEWLRRSPEHVQAYLGIASVWADLPDRDHDGQIDIAALIASARASGGDVIALTTSEADARHPAPRRHQVRYAVAAAVVLTFLAAAITAWMGWGANPTYRTDIGEQRSIALPDGSTVDMNSRSQVRIRFSERERTVDLVAGQALFEVAKDTARPFIVRSNDTQVAAVGTRFDVYRKGARTIVTVVEGRVAVVAPQTDFNQSSGSGAALIVGREAPRADALYVSAGEQLTVSPQAPAAPARVDVGTATAWMQRKLVFDATPLRLVAEEFNRYNRRTLVIEGDDLGAVGISGVYSSTNPSSLLTFLRDLPGVHLVESEREIRVTRTP